MKFIFTAIALAACALLVQGSGSISTAWAAGLDETHESDARGTEKSQNPIPRTIIFSCPTPPDNPNFFRIRELYTEAFRRLGHSFQLVHHPVDDSLQNAADGFVHGDTARVIELEQSGRYPSLVRVDEPVGISIAGAYAVRPGFFVDSWKSLASVPKNGGKVGFSKGFLAAEIHVPAVVGHENTMVARDGRHGLRLLESGRIAVLVEPVGIIDTHLNSDEFRHLPVRKIGTPARLLTFPYVHQSIGHLAPALARALREMKQDGTFKRITGHDPVSKSSD